MRVILRKRYILSTIAILTASAGLLRADNWPRWRGPNADGISKETTWNPAALKGEPKIAWEAELGKGHSNCSIVGRYLFTMGNKGDKDIVYCLNAQTGKTLWTHSYPCPQGNYEGPRATPIVDKSAVYTFSRNSDAFCLDGKTGKVIWSKNLSREHGAQNISWGFAGSPLVVGDTVIYNAGTHGIALNKRTGAEVWSSPSKKCGYATPVLFEKDGQQQLAIFAEADIFGVDPASGRKLWSQPWKTKYNVNAADPIYDHGNVFVSSAYGRGCGLIDINGGSARVVYENTEMACHFASPILYKGYIYGVHGNTGGGQLRCLEPKTGKITWSQAGKFENLMLADGKLIAIDRKGFLVIIEASPTAYREIARAAILDGGAKNWTAPVLANGLIYCRNSKGMLRCIDLRK